MNSNATNPVLLMARITALVFFSVLAAWVADHKLGLGLVASLMVGSGILAVGVFSLIKLQGSARELGITFGLKVLSVTAYKILNFVVSTWLIRQLGFPDASVGVLIMCWGVFMTLATIVSGSLTDVLGLRRTLWIGVGICVLSRLVMAVSDHQLIALTFGLFPLAVGEALCTPVLVAALRLYSKPSQRSVAFSLFYGLMNFGFMLGYFIHDGVLEWWQKRGEAEWMLLGHGLSVQGVLLLVSLLVDMLMLPLILWLRPGVQMTEEGFVPLPQIEHPMPAHLGVVGRIRFTVFHAARDTVRSLVELCRSSGFAKLLVFLLMIGLLKIVFNLMDYVLNPFAEREIGLDAVSKVGRLNATNSILILVLAPLVGILTRKLASYSMVILGGFITAASFVFMALPPSWFKGLADSVFGAAIGGSYLGVVGEVHPYLIMIFLWQVVFSIGEAFYSPRVYEYAASIAPPGKEASYSSLSYIPLLIGKITTGLAFAGLLNHYCPAEGERQSGTMWMIIGLMVLVAPVGLLLLKRHIRVEETK